MKNKFIVIEGVDGVGKTSAAKALAKAIGGEYVLTPMMPLDHIMVSLENGSTPINRFVNDLEDIHVRFTFYLWAVVHASHLIRELLKTTSVVCDRYISSTLAYHAALDPLLAGFDVSALNILDPDYEFFLTVQNDEEWHHRLHTREDQSRGDENIEGNWRLLRRVEEEYGRLLLKPIDTSGMTKEQVLGLLLMKIGVE